MAFKQWSRIWISLIKFIFYIFLFKVTIIEDSILLIGGYGHSTIYSINTPDFSTYSVFLNGAGTLNAMLTLNENIVIFNDNAKLQVLLMIIFF